VGFLDKVKETSKQVGEKAQQLAEAGQDKFDDLKTDKQISTLKEQIGDIVYRGHTGDAPDDADAEITRIVAEIRAAEASRPQPGAAQPGEPQPGA
jgi:hypothetical protein